jgi:hypothetical protein
MKKRLYAYRKTPNECNSEKIKQNNYENHEIEDIYIYITAKNHFLIKKKILNLGNYFLKRETDFLNKKNDS